MNRSRLRDQWLIWGCLVLGMVFPVTAHVVRSSVPDGSGEPLAVSTAPPERVESAARAGDDPDDALRLTDAEEAPSLGDDCTRESQARDDAQRLGPRAFEPVKASFAVQFGDHVSPHRIISTFVLPGESVEIETLMTRGDERFEVSADAGAIMPVSDDEWRWTAPKEPGVYCVEVHETVSDERVCINGFVMVPYNGEDVVNGYRIGAYETIPLRNDPAYRMPRGLIEVTPENEDTWVSPHFQLRQFLCKQESDYPKYLVLQTRLLLKLELMLERLAEAGYSADTFYVMSAYRTPHYNRAIGNSTRYSRHAYGDAADVFIDIDADGWMDDLDFDGNVDRADAKVMYDSVLSLADDTWYAPFRGGLGLYGPKPHRGPFIHVDARGYPARWQADGRLAWPDDPHVDPGIARVRLALDHRALEPAPDWAAELFEGFAEHP